MYVSTVAWSIARLMYKAMTLDLFDQNRFVGSITLSSKRDINAYEMINASFANYFVIKQYSIPP